MVVKLIKFCVFILSIHTLDGGWWFFFFFISRSEISFCSVVEPNFLFFVSFSTWHTCRKIKIGDSSPWFWIVCFCGFSWQHPYLEHLLFSVKHHHYTTILNPSTLSSQSSPNKFSIFRFTINTKSEILETETYKH